MPLIAGGRPVIDLRSDTVTHPTPEMREAMARAEVGDDVFGEDPTVRRLERRSADLMGKEAALFVASGTMGNLATLLTHCKRGDEAILGDRSHTFLYEAGGSAALGGIHPRTVPNQPDGTLLLEDIAGAIRPDDVHFPRSSLVCLENTHNRCGGAALGVDYTETVGKLAREHGLALHIDGARIFHAAAALGVEAAALAAPADSVTFCLSKALSAPVGSVLCGTSAFVREARRARKVLGGGMRQAGVLAAAGLVALDRVLPRLGDDHARARRLAEGIGSIPGIEVEPVHTNLVYFSLGAEVPANGEELLVRLAERDVKILAIGPRHFRAVLHYWIGPADVEAAIAALREAIVSA